MLFRNLFIALSVCTILLSGLPTSAADPLSSVERVINYPDASTPLVSPDGTCIAFTVYGSSGILISENSTVRTLTQAPFSGWRFKWSPDSQSIVFRAREENDQFRLYRISRNGDLTALGPPATTISTPSFSGHVAQALISGTTSPMTIIEDTQHRQPLTFTAAMDGIVYYWIGNLKTALTDGSETCFEPMLSPNDQWILYQSLISGLHIVSIDGLTHREIGPGSDPIWSPDSRFVLFCRTQDDGHRITGSELFISYIDRLDQPVALTNTRDRIERHPSFASGGDGIVFDALDGIYRGQIDLKNLKLKIEGEVQP